MSPLAQEILLRWLALRPCAPGAAYELCGGAERAALEVEQYKKDCEAKAIADRQDKEEADRKAKLDELEAMEAAEQDAKKALADIELRKLKDEEERLKLAKVLGLPE